MQDNSVCICTVVSGWYSRYINLWLACIKMSYPEYDTEVVYVQDSQKYGAACIRFIEDFRKYNKARFFYITDADMLIMREEPTLLNFHLAEMKESGLPYSNTLRSREGENRFTGLHFCNESYFDLTETARREARFKLAAGEIGNSATDDEIMLKGIIDSLNKPYPPMRHLVNRHHGIHLGVFRGVEKEPWSAIKRKLDERVNHQRASWWLKSLENPWFADVVKKTADSDIRIRFQLDILFKFCKGVVK